MIAAVLGGRGASGYRGRSAFYDLRLEQAMGRLLALGEADCRRVVTEIGGRRIHHLESGSGPPVLLLHGGGGGAANWYRLLAPLARTRRVLAPDLPGFGFSDPIEPRAPLGQQVAAHLAEWLAAVGVGNVDVVGTSFGALVGLRLAERCDVRRLVLTDAVGLTEHTPWVLRLVAFPLFARLVAHPTRRGTRALLRGIMTAGPLAADDEAALLDYLYWSARRGDVALMARAFSRFAGMAGQRDVLTTDQLRAVAGRLLLVWGERDEFLPVADIAAKCALAGCRPVRIIPGAGHSPNWEQPDQLRKVIEEFLDE